MTEELVPYETGQMTLTDALTLGEVLYKSGFFKDITSAAQATVKVLAGQELGVPPLASMRGVFVSQEGNIGLHAALVAALIKRHPRYDYKVLKFTETEAAVEFFENGQSSGIYPLTMAQAKAANMDKQWNKTEGKFKDKIAWKNFGRNMLISRCFTGGGRIYTPDIFIGAIYTPEELEIEHAGDDVITVLATDVTVAEVPQRKPQSRQEQKQTPAQDQTDLYGHPLKKKQNGDRPWDAVTLKANLLKRAEQLCKTDDAWKDKPEPGYVGAMNGKLNGILGNDDRRHTFLTFARGDPSSKNMNKADVKAVMDWIEGQAGMEIVTDEANRLVNSVITAQAMGELSGMEEDHE